MKYSKNNYSSLFFVLIATILVIIAFIFENHNTQRSEKSVFDNALPAFSLPALFDPATRVTNHSLAGRVYLLHFWASGCGVCRAEHATLLMIANTLHIPIYGIAYKDTMENAKAWLQTAGNPYLVSAIDTAGISGYPFALYGTPHTLIVDRNGMIRYRYAGIISQADWETILQPLVIKIISEQPKSL